MPLYEYRCAAGHRYEKIQSFSAPEQLECPKCGLIGERLLSAPAIQFKGSGFYLTDYGKAGGVKSGAGESNANAGSDPKSGGDSKSASESKPAADPGKSTPAPTPSSAPASSGGSTGAGVSTSKTPSTASSS